MTHAVIEPHPVCLYGFGSFVRMLKRTSSPTTIMRESSPIARSHCSWTATALATKFLENRAGWLQRGRNSSGKPQMRLGALTIPYRRIVWCGWQPRSWRTASCGDRLSLQTAVPRVPFR